MSLEEYDNRSKSVESYQVLDADSSQQESILKAKSGSSSIMHGPPGTGKSQTIANIIAETLAQGKKVLFVSEKMAALEVVKKRLEKESLGDFCLELHSLNTNKKAVLQELNRVIQTTKSYPSTRTPFYKRPSGVQYLSDQAYRELKHDETAFIFDATDYGQNRLIIHGEVCTLAASRMEILEQLFRNLKPVSQRELQEELGINQVSRYMNALRDDLSRYGLDEDTITAANGYRINHPRIMDLPCYQDSKIHKVQLYFSWTF